MGALHWSLCLSLVGLAAAMAAQQPAGGSPALVFEGARLIVGDGQPPIEDAAFVVEDARITRVGPRAAVRRPPGATVVDLRGKTVIPTIIDTHSHLGYTNVATARTAAAEYSRDNLIDHLHRYAYYGIAATLSMGLDRDEVAYDLRARPPAGAARLLTAGPGLAMPNAGPFAAHWRDAAYGITTVAEARSAVSELAGRKVDAIKIWVDDRNKTVTPLPPSLYVPIIEDAHARGLKVIAHMYYLADAKALLRAGIDGFAHGVRDLEVDDEILRLFKERPRVFVIPNLPDTPPAIGDLAWLSETLPASQIEALRGTAVAAPARPRLFDIQARSLAKLSAAGVRIAMGTDAGVGAPYGWAAHAELADFVAAGLTPAQALTAATKTAAEVMGLADLGTVTVGKSADFIVLDGNPLDDIINTRRIASVYLRGQAVDRAALTARWRR